MVFSGIGVLLLVSNLSDPSVEVILTIKSVSGGQGCRRESKDPRRSL
jgi:hypothetical protein